MAKRYLEGLENTYENIRKDPIVGENSLISSGQYRDIPPGIIQDYQTGKITQEEARARITGTPIFNPSLGNLIDTGQGFKTARGQTASYNPQTNQYGLGGTGVGFNPIPQGYIPPTPAGRDPITGQRITSDSLTPASPFPYVTPPTTPSFDVKGLNAEPSISPLSPEETELSKRLKDLGIKQTEAAGRSTFQAQQEAERNVPELERIQRDLSSQLKLSQLEAANIQAVTQKEAGVTSAIDARQRAEALRLNSVKSLLIYAQLEMAKGNLLTSQDAADRATNLKYGALEVANKAERENIELLLKDPSLTESQKKRVEERDRIISERKDKIAEGKTARSNILSIIYDSEFQANAPQLVKDQLTALANKDINTPEDAVIAANLGARYKKAPSEVTGMDGDVSQILAYAQQYASTGQIPSGLPKGTFGLVAQTAKNLPKPVGTLVDFNTGVRPSNVSDKFQDGIAALYDIDSKTNDLITLFNSARPGDRQANIRYESIKKEIVDLLARARSGAALTEFEFNNYMSLLPVIGSGKGIIGGERGQIKLDQFKKNINGSLNNKLRINNLQIVGYGEEIPNLDQYLSQ